jgi:cephalosporin-C deacetylase-like acetyl esterase
VSDDVFDVYRQQFTYDNAPLDARTERTGQTVSGFPYEVVSFSTPYPGSRMQAMVMLPNDVSSPLQTIVLYPGSGAMFQPNVDLWAATDNSGIHSALRSGRAVVMPVLKGTFSRQDELRSTWPAQTKLYSDYAIRWVQEVSRTLDYLESRPEFDANSFAYAGLSWGGRMGVIVMAVEDRFNVGMLFSGGLASGKSLPEVDQINFVTRVKKPILMLNGLRDSVEPFETAQKPLYELLGTADQDKRHVTFPKSGHNLPRTERIREMLAWLDHYLGPAVDK